MLSPEYRVRKSCAICGNMSLDSIMHFGEVPLAGDFPTKDELSMEKNYEMSLQFCRSCYLLQTDSVIDANRLFKDYRYMSSIGLSSHFTHVAAMLKSRFNLDENSVVVEIGSNDGVLQKPFMDLGIRCIGFEPSINISSVAREKGCEVINDFFNETNALEYIGSQKADLIVCNNAFAHIDDIHSVMKAVKGIIKAGGSFVIEVHYVKNLIDQLQYDNIYHEHIYYYSLQSLKNLFDQYEMSIADCDEIPIHSGSIRVFVKNNDGPLPLKVTEKLDGEVMAGLTDIGYFLDFAARVKIHIGKVKEKLTGLKKDHAKIVGYGASGRANMLCNLCDLTPDTINYIVDESPERCNRYIAGKHIGIVSRDYLLHDVPSPDYIFIFAWNYSKMIMEKLASFNYKFIIPFPEIRVVSNYSELVDFISI